jgi:hypothetical protein
MTDDLIKSKRITTHPHGRELDIFIVREQFYSNNSMAVPLTPVGGSNIF